MRKVLIANRGEIACRIIRSCRSLGLQTVAVYSEADAGALHVELADEASPIGPAPATQSYLDAHKILEVARMSAADAVHPGYGFLSENADFAQSVLDAGLLWIGPAPDAIRSMGDKQRARELAQEAGVPIVPGSPRLTGDAVQDIARYAEPVGFPLLVKAAAGGGGIGMRRVDDPAALPEIVASVQNAATKSFGDPTVYLEGFLPRARHVEVQVFGFGDGRAVHLYERDCSVQRRFQKVVEETPAPGLPVEVREAMCEAALSLCRHARYAGAGTVEFIIDTQSFEFFFLEMNTRIQVEHPITEMVTGLDLVRMQLELAGGALADVAQETIAPQGCAIELRLYAEDPSKIFMPSPGRLTAFELPASTRSIRVDSGYRGGDTISHYYDPLIAKVIVHGASRDAAIAAGLDALAQLRVEGVQTNQDFLGKLLADEAFRAGDVHTRFIEERAKNLIPPKPKPRPAEAPQPA